MLKAVMCLLKARTCMSFLGLGLHTGNGRHKFSADLHINKTLQCQAAAAQKRLATATDATYPHVNAMLGW